MTLPTEFTAELLAKLQLARTADIGPVTYKRLLIKHGSAQNVVAAWPQISKPGKPLCAMEKIKDELRKLAAAGGWMVLWGEQDYPQQLAELPDPPIALSGLGNICHIYTRQVAMVGNRSASGAGLNFSREVSAALARAGVVVTSGLARGIDTAAHQGALAANGPTIAVVAGGVDHIYPPENAQLREQIIANGCVVSEQAWGMAPTAHLFPRRNRIIAGLAVGVVVSEATRHSGSLITAECALNYGREVWAVPGSPSEARSGGPNWLLKNGATLIEGAQDVLAGLPAKPAPYVKRAATQPGLFDVAAPLVEEDVVLMEEALLETETAPGALQSVFSLLSVQGISFDDIVRQTGLDEAELNALLVELELDGHAARDLDGRWRRP